MAELDDLVGASVKRLAAPADPSGVAATIARRVDAGDPGSPALASGFAGGWWARWLPFLGPLLALVVASVLVGGVAVAGTLGVRERPPAAAPIASGTPSPTPTATSTPTKAPAAPPAAAPAPAEPVAPEEEDEDEEQAPPPPPPPSDVTAPVISQYWASPGQLCADPQTGWSTTAEIVVVVSDDVGVAGVSGSWAELGGGSLGLSTGGGDWVGYFDPPSGAEGAVTISLVAWDAAGNSSAPVSVGVQVFALGNCLT